MLLLPFADMEAKSSHFVLLIVLIAPICDGGGLKFVLLDSLKSSSVRWLEKANKLAKIVHYNYLKVVNGVRERGFEEPIKAKVANQPYGSNACGWYVIAFAAWMIENSNDDKVCSRNLFGICFKFVCLCVFLLF